MARKKSLPAKATTTPTAPDGTGRSKTEIAQNLNSYWIEADNARRTGLNPRDDKWKNNLDLYWNRYDFSKKAKWQAKETMPEVPAFVDRFAAAMKEAMVTTPEGFYTIIDPADVDRDLTPAVKRMVDMWLSRAGTNQTGSLLGFPAVFEEQAKMGALIAMSSVVLWKNDVPGGRVAVESVDPRHVWLDHTYRNLYRIRRTEIDKHDLKKMAKEQDKRGKAIWDLEEINRLVSHVVEETRTDKERSTGSGQEQTSNRKPIVLDEYIATVLDTNGDVVGEEDALFVVANNQFLIRGPEKNPFWHKRDWLVYAPLIVSPLSPYGRTYMEDFGSVSKTFTELTNMILDAVHTSSLKAFAMVPGMLLNPEQANEGITPNKLFLLEEGMDPKQFAQALDLGTLPAESLNMWTSIKNELREAAGINEIGMGQFAPKGRTSAAEIMETSQSSSALIRSVAQSIETRWLEPTLDLVWKTGLQHVSPSDKSLADAAGAEMYAALISRRKELISRPFTFQARGISTMIQKSKMLRSIMTILSIVAGNEVLLMEFLQIADMRRLVELLFELSDVDIRRLQLTERERMIRSVTQPLMQAQAGADAAGPSGASPQGANEVKSMVNSMGIRRGGT